MRFSSLWRAPAAAAAAGVLAVTHHTTDPVPQAPASSCSASASLRSSDRIIGRSTAPPAATPPGSVRAPPLTAGKATESDPLAPSETIAQEAALLERARRLLGQSPERALLLANHHLESYSPGRLGAERELIAIDALVRLGRVDQARHRAAPLLTGDSGSLYARRVRAVIERSDALPPPTGAR
jgi:hypothetical protein